jgi:6-phosphogluconolactonase
MKLEVYADADAVANKAAGLIATMARDAVADRGRFVMAVSGGHTPWQMLRALAMEGRSRGASGRAHCARW